MPSSIPESVDVLVVGSGVAGAVAARKTAASGLATLLVDRLPATDVGRKVCGNGLADDGIETISRWTEAPGGAEVAWRIDSGLVVLRNRRTCVTLPKSGVVLNRPVFGQRLLSDAIGAGALFVDACTCVGWGDRADGRVRLRSALAGDVEVSARVVIDASGYRSVLTKSGGTSRCDAIARADVGIGYREIVPLTEPLAKPREAVVDTGANGVRGGYAWIFPLGERLANVGIGASLAMAGSDLRARCRGYIRSHPGLAASAPIDSGTGLLPLRRPLATMVGDGFLTAGDAGCQTNPLHGGGISPAIAGAGMAGEAAIAALADGRASTEALWNYNGRFMREIGYVHAGHDFLRKYLFSLTDDEFDFLALEFAPGVLSLGALRPPLRRALRLLGRAALRPGLARRFLRAVRLVENIREVYRDYPDSPARLESWIGHVEYHVRAMERLCA